MISLFQSIGDIFGESIKLYALMTPPAVLSAFISRSRKLDARQKVKTAFKASLAIFIIGLILYIWGSRLFELFGFTLAGFRIGSGVLLMLLAISLTNDEEDEAGDANEGDFSIVPLAVPLGMGPATIGTVMVMGASAATSEALIYGIIALLIASLAMFILLCSADTVSRILHENGIILLSKLTGLLLAAIAAQVIFTGITNFFID